MPSKFGTTVLYNNYILISLAQAKLIALGLEKIMLQAQQEAKQLVRVDTTTLQKSIKIRKVNEFIYELYTNVEYAVYNEYGTAKMPAQPFMFPAAKNAHGRIDAMISAVLAQGGS